MANEMKKAAPFGMKDKVGYMFGDFGNDFTFLLSSSFLMKFYTDVMGVNAAIVGMVMMIARFVDAFTDVGMGQIVDHSKPTKDGKFRPWIKRMCGPVAIASFLIYQSGLAGMPYGFKVAWLFITYILWGSIFYTSINIPYGSMASAVSADPKDRAELSTWRTIGSTLANMVIGVATPMVAYVVVDGKTVMSGSRMTIIAGVFSICAILCYIVCFKLTRERVEVPASSQKVSASAIFKSIFTNRALLGIIVAAIFVLLSQLTVMSLAGYVYPNVYGQRCRTVHCQPAGHGGHADRLRTLCFQAGCKVRQEGAGCCLQHLLRSGLAGLPDLASGQRLGLCGLLHPGQYRHGLLQHHHLGHDHRRHRRRRGPQRHP